MRKQTIMTWNLGKGSRQLKSLLVTGRMFMLLSLGSMVMVLVIGVGAIIQQKSSSSPVSSMKGFAASVSEGTFNDILAMEMPGADDGSTSSSISTKQMSAFLVQVLTDINPNDPKSLLAREYPGMNAESAVLIRPGETAGTTVEPEDNAPIHDGSDDPVSDPAVEGNNPGGDGSGRPSPDADEDFSTDGGSAAGGAGGQTNTPETQPDKTPAKPTTGSKKVVFIYHSHARESWNPVLGKTVEDPQSTTKNISLLGKRLAQKLEEQGIGAIASATDYPTAIKDYRWVLSYKYSKKTVTEAMAAHRELQYFFDIHRDSQKKDLTTATINGKTYAQVFFIIGHGNPNWKKNEAFASEIHTALEKAYPGISRGVWGKTSANGNGEYNQSVSPDSVLIEVGGVDNTLEESNRTIDALAKVISDMYWKDEKVSTKVAS
ncbi:stage II sporulation protein P [Paenibacillus phyllosphaerae]|uniref:Stage II sporulation protein P n=1 Tax=Paenibacillus phyllosphaerae TaxID=274593 RepID=A0A7W5FLG1_9BACL|nr:stage II sporulation protein P [Paenibacillus phyllosphaerae]MBB3108957.1 stage II sporulation protein P [Paenibacillus phyllosphaerae]